MAAKKWSVAVDVLVGSTTSKVLMFLLYLINLFLFQFIFIKLLLLNVLLKYIMSMSKERIITERRNVYKERCSFLHAGFVYIIRDRLL